MVSVNGESWRLYLLLRAIPHNFSEVWWLERLHSSCGPMVVGQCCVAGTLILPMQDGNSKSKQKGIVYQARFHFT